MVRAVAVVAVRQEENEPAPLTPLGLAGRDELVHDALRVVGEIAELRLPQHERGWTGVDAESVLESHHRVLRERGIAHQEPVLVPEAHVIDRVDRSRGPGAVQHGVPVVEGASLDILPAEPNVAVLARRRRRVLARVPVQHQRGEREQLRGAPVHAELAFHHLPAVLQQLARVRVRDEVRGEESHVLQPGFSSHVVQLRQERLGGADGIAHADAVVLLRLCPRRLVVQVGAVDELGQLNL